jgi:hypothetical protein
MFSSLQVMLDLFLLDASPIHAVRDAHIPFVSSLADIRHKPWPGGHSLLRSWTLDNKYLSTTPFILCSSTSFLQSFAKLLFQIIAFVRFQRKS